MKLGVGGLTTEEITRNSGRRLFLQVLERLVPQSIEDLRAAHGAFYRLYLWALRDPDFWASTMDRLAPLRDQPVSPTLLLVEIRRGLGVTTWAALRMSPHDVAELRSLLIQWSASYNLTDEWCMDVALDTLYAWTRQVFYALHQLQGVTPLQPGGPMATLLLDHFEYPPLGYSVSGAFRRDGTLSITVQDWKDPARETPGEAKKRILAEIKDIVERHLEIKEEVLAQSGDSWARPLAKRSETHFEWLVRYQCLDETFTSIAGGSHYSREGVAGAVRELSDIIGLELRQPRRGRPKRARDRDPRHRGG